jgi:hypothetical protein
MHLLEYKKQLVERKDLTASEYEKIKMYAFSDLLVFSYISMIELREMLRSLIIKIEREKR